MHLDFGWNLGVEVTGGPAYVSPFLPTLMLFFQWYASKSQRILGKHPIVAYMLEFYYQYEIPRELITDVRNVSAKGYLPTTEKGLNTEDIVEEMQTYILSISEFFFQNTEEIMEYLYLLIPS